MRESIRRWEYNLCVIQLCRVHSLGIKNLLESGVDPGYIQELLASLNSEHLTGTRHENSKVCRHIQWKWDNMSTSYST